MATIQSVQSGSEIISSADGVAITITLDTSVVLSQSFLVCTYKAGESSAREARSIFLEELSSTEITLTRTSSAFASTITVEWYVYEFDSSVNVQHLKFSPASITESQTISAVNVGSTFVTASFEASGNSYNRWTAELSSSTNVDFQSVGNLLTTNIAYQVVEFDSADAAVQIKTGSIPPASTDANIPINAVSVANSFIASEYGFSSSTFTPAVRHRDKCSITSSTELTYSRTGAHTASTYSYVVYLVEMLDGTTVQSGTATIPNGSTLTTETITPLSNGGMIHGTSDGNQLSTSTASLGPENLRASQKVDGSTVTFDRLGDTGDLEIVWFAVDWNAGSSFNSFGAFISGDSEISGLSGLAVNSSGQFISSDSVINGFSDAVVDSSGSFISSDSVINGASSLSVDSSGLFVSSDSIVSGSSDPFIGSFGSFVSGNSEIAGLSGLSVNSLGEFVTLDSEILGSSGLLVNSAGHFVSSNSIINGTSVPTAGSFGAFISADSAILGLSGLLVNSSGDFVSDNSVVSGVSGLLVDSFGAFVSSNSIINGFSTLPFSSFGAFVSGNSKITGFQNDVIREPNFVYDIQLNQSSGNITLNENIFTI